MKRAFIASLPIIAGYLVLGIPCGLLADRAGMSLVQIILMSLLFYSGAGQYMVANMWLSSTPIASIVLSISLVNARQLLYAASLSRFCQEASKRLSLLFAATVTDESFGVNLAHFEADAKRGDPGTGSSVSGQPEIGQPETGNPETDGSSAWSVREATLVNLFALASWAIANTLGAVLGNLLSVPATLAAFAMTSIFICLLFMQRFTKPKVVAACAAAAGVLACKLVGLEDPAILVGALMGVAAALIAQRDDTQEKDISTGGEDVHSGGKQR
jgi:predicted branched-subunit amino acid permease